MSAESTAYLVLKFTYPGETADTLSTFDLIGLGVQFPNSTSAFVDQISNKLYSISFPTHLYHSGPPFDFGVAMASSTGFVLSDPTFDSTHCNGNRNSV